MNGQSLGNLATSMTSGRREGRCEGPDKEPLYPSSPRICYSDTVVAMGLALSDRWLLCTSHFAQH